MFQIPMLKLGAGIARPEEARTNPLGIDTSKLVSLVQQMRSASVTYELGAKARVHDLPGSISKIDCSGFVRYAIAYATGGRIVMPDGSWNQDDWCKKLKFEVVNYRKTAGLSDDRLRIAFMHGAPVGHVWFVLNGKTIESHGGVGPDRRDWQTPVLISHVQKCYLLT